MVLKIGKHSENDNESKYLFHSLLISNIFIYFFSLIKNSSRISSLKSNTTAKNFLKNDDDDEKYNNGKEPTLTLLGIGKKIKKNIKSFPKNDQEKKFVKEFVGQFCSLFNNKLKKGVQFEMTESVCLSFILSQLKTELLKIKKQE